MTGHSPGDWHDPTSALLLPAGLGRYGVGMTPEARELLDRVLAHALSGPAAGGKGVAFLQYGEMRRAPDQPWAPFTAEQTISADPPGLSWRARFRMAPLVYARVRDFFEGGSGGLDVRVFGMRVMRARGPEIDTGQLMRWLAELPWCPRGYLSPRIEWSAPGPTTLRAMAMLGALRAEVDYEVAADGRVTRSGGLRQRQVGKGYVPTQWSGAFEGEIEVGSTGSPQACIRVPAKAAVTWHLPEGDFTYWRGTVTDFRVT